MSCLWSNLVHKGGCWTLCGQKRRAFPLYFYQWIVFVSFNSGSSNSRNPQYLCQRSFSSGVQGGIPFLQMIFFFRGAGGIPFLQIIFSFIGVQGAMETAVWELGIIPKPCHIFGEHFVAHIKLLNDDAYWDISKLFPPPITHPNHGGKNVNCVTLDRIEGKVHFNMPQQILKFRCSLCTLNDNQHICQIDAWLIKELISYLCCLWFCLPVI